MTPLKSHVVRLTKTVTALSLLPFDDGSETRMIVFVSKLVLSDPSSKTVTCGVTTAVVSKEVESAVGKVRVVGLKACNKHPVQRPGSDVE